jgi:hypothetical protein
MAHPSFLTGILMLKTYELGAVCDEGLMVLVHHQWAPAEGGTDRPGGGWQKLRKVSTCWNVCGRIYVKIMGQQRQWRNSSKAF